MRSRLPAPPPGAGWVATSGLILGLAHPPLHLLLPSFIGLVPFGIWLERLPEGEEGRWLAFRGGFWLGIIYYTLLLHWMATALVVYSPLAVLALGIVVVSLSLLLAVAATGMHHVRRRLGWPLWVALPVFWTVAEWFRAHLGPLSFPWQELGYTLAGFPQLIGAADVVGARGISFWLAMLAGLLATAYVAGRSGHRATLWAALAGWLVLLSAPVGYSLWRWRTLETRTAATVTVVQPNIPEELKQNAQVALDSTLRAAEGLLTGHQPSGQADLVVLPETAIPGPIDPILAVGFNGRPDLYYWLGGLMSRSGSAVLVGAIGVENHSLEEWSYYNSAYLIAPRRPAARYDKRHLVPVVERFPFVDPGWRWAGYLGGFGVGGRPAVLQLHEARFGVLICYESIFAGLGRAYRRQGADFLVNITNDAWFGRETPWWSRSGALWQHPSHLVLRAIEYRIGIVRAANTGISGMVDPLGRVNHATGLFVPAIFTAPVLTTDGLTLFARTGDLLGWVAAAAAVVGAALPRGRRRR